MIWWIILFSALGRSAKVSIVAGVTHVQEVTYFEKLSVSPIVGFPWAVIGSVLGVLIGWKGGLLEILTTVVGMLIGIGISLDTSLLDGWLVLTMPIYAISGACIGWACGAMISLARLLTSM